MDEAMYYRGANPADIEQYLNTPTNTLHYKRYLTSTYLRTYVLVLT